MLYNNKDVNDPFPLDNPEFEKEANKLAKKNKGRKPVKIILVLLILLIIGGISGYFVYDQFVDTKDYTTSDLISETVIVNIPDGSTVSDIADILVDNDVIKSTKSFISASKKTNKALPSGFFTLQKHMTAQNAFNALLDPNNIAVNKLNIAEGATVKQIVPELAKTLSQVSNVTESDIEKAMDNEASTLLPDGVTSYEGWLFPANYEFAYDITPADAIATMVNKTVSILKANNVPESDYEEIITKASIIQLEVGKPDDMTKVARVIDNRLEIDMVLGMDSIVAYGADGGDGSRNLELKQSDLDDASSPYNARKHQGLPPTPISSPSEAAIQAAIKPAAGDWLYFITVDPSTQKTLFLDTEDEFEAARADYKTWCAQNPDVCGI